MTRRNNNNKRRARSSLSAQSMNSNRTNSQRLLGGVHHAVIRGRVTGSGGFSVLAGNLAGAVGAIATSTTSLRSTTSAVKVSHVRLTIPPPTAGNVNSARLTWFGGANNEAQASLLNSTNNPARTAIIQGAPPKKSTASFWNDTDINPMIGIHAPVGTLVEIQIQVTSARPGQPGLVPNVTVAGLTVGDVYYTALANSLLTIDDGN
jgi:hypothetical protein